MRHTTIKELHKQNDTFKTPFTPETLTYSKQYSSCRKGGGGEGIEEEAIILFSLGIEKVLKGSYSVPGIDFLTP
jgi:hypothetical protein